jgi:hypothetical protein
MLRGLVDDATARVRLTMPWTAIAGVAARCGAIIVR